MSRSRKHKSLRNRLFAALSARQSGPARTWIAAPPHTAHSPYSRTTLVLNLSEPTRSVAPSGPSRTVVSSIADASSHATWRITLCTAKLVHVRAGHVVASYSEPRSLLPRASLTRVFVTAHRPVRVPFVGFLKEEHQY